MRTYSVIPLSVALLLALPAMMTADQYDGLTATQKRILLRTCTSKPPVSGSGLFTQDVKQCWDRGRVLKVHFLDGTKENQSVVLKTAAEWTACTNVRFEKTEETGDIRITFADQGFRSLVGRDAELADLNESTMTLGFTDDCSSDDRRSAILHEFGHALGFSHEHQSPDAKIRWKERKVIELFSGPPNYWSVDTIRQNILNPMKPENAKGGAWTRFDRYSIMIYPIDKDLTMDGKGIPFNTTLSPLDKKKAAELYK